MMTFNNVRNIKINIVLKASRAVLIGLFSLNEAPLELFKFIFDYLPYFEIKIIKLKKYKEQDKENKKQYLYYI
jgi:hypothetical protein